MSITSETLVTQILSTGEAELEMTIAQAVETLLLGGCVGMPTETVYGLAADALNPMAIARVFETKRRPAFDPLIVHVTPEMDLSQWVELTETGRQLMKQFWPGPLTLLLRKKEVISDLVTSGHPTVAVRCPAHPVARALLNTFGGPLVAPSANLFGQLSPTSAEAVLEGLSGRLRYIIDGGACRVGLESTIVDATASPPALPILRLGGISPDVLSELGYTLTFPTPIIGQAPGTLKNHYAPRTPLFLWDSMREQPRLSKRGELETQSPDEKLQVFPDRWAFLGWSRPQDGFKMSWALSERGSSTEAAVHLFSSLRSIDQNRCEGAIAELPPLHGLGAAIADRLRRGASGFVTYSEKSWRLVSDE